MFAEKIKSLIPSSHNFLHCKIFYIIITATPLLFEMFNVISPKAEDEDN